MITGTLRTWDGNEGLVDVIDHGDNTAVKSKGYVKVKLDTWVSGRTKLPRGGQYVEIDDVIPGSADEDPVATKWGSSLPIARAAREMTSRLTRPRAELLGIHDGSVP